MSVIIQLRRDTSANWTSVNPILAEGEMGLETDTNKFKFGDGLTAWNSLSYFKSGNVDSVNGQTGVVTITLDSLANDQQMATIDSGITSSDVSQITTNQNAIGTLSSLTTTVKTDLVSALNEVDGVAGSALQAGDIVDNTSSTATNKPLSANMGKSLQDQVDNLKARGRFLALWNCATGLPETNPPESPYTYASGDYYVIGTIAESGQTNYKPSGSSYTDDVPSTTVETAEVAVDDCYFYDGTNWHLQSNAQKTLSFSNIAGDPYDNTNLAAALNGKQDELIQGTGIAIDSSTNTISNSGVRGISTGSTNGTISVNTNGTSSEVAVAGLGTAAYTASTDYATSTQGGKADTAIQDVQVNGTSIVSGTTANIPKATSSSLGVIAIGSGLAIQSGNGSVYIVAATESNLINKLNSSNPVVSTNLNIAVREGLGNNNLTWTDTYKTNARTTIGAVGDVQVNGTSVTTSGVANIPYASTSDWGVIKIVNNYGIGSNSNGQIYIMNPTDAQITGKSGFIAVTCSTMDKALKNSLTTNTNTLTTAEKATACSWLGASQLEFVDWE